MSVQSALAASRAVNFKRLGAATVVAVVVNLAVYAVATAAGATWVANGQSIGWFMVLFATVVPMVAGGVLTWLLAKWRGGATRVMAWVGLIFAVVGLPMPFLASDDAATSWALASMHVLTGLIWFFAVLPRQSSSAE